MRVLFSIVFSSLFLGLVGAAEKPNVLFLAIDDLRPALGCYGDEEVHSPHIDDLAARGVRFENAHCQLAVCNPSRVSLLTGLRPDSSRVWTLDVRFRETIPNVVTLPQHFKANGYITLGYGKIFHNPWPDNVSWSEPHAWPESRLWSDEAKRELKQFKAKLKREGKSQRSIDRLRARATEKVEIDDGEHIDGAIADQAIEAMQRLAKKEEPFFLAAGFIRPHLPFVVPKKYWDLYDPESLSLPEDAAIPLDSPGFAMNTMYELRDYFDYLDTPEPREGTLTEAQKRNLKHGYYASVSFVDAQVGRILDELKRLKLDENTVVVLWSDHGYKLGEHNSWCKQTNYEIDTRVPLIVLDPRAKGNGVPSDSLVELVDVYPTLCDLAGIPSPKKLEGVSLKPVLNAPDKTVKDAAVSQFLRRQKDRELMGYAYRTERWRYIEWVDRKDGRIVDRELYDHQVDSGETKSLARSKKHAATMAQLSKDLRETLPKPLGVDTGKKKGLNPKRPQLTFKNVGTQPISFVWLPGNGEKREPKFIQPGKAASIGTTKGHRFRVVGDGFKRVVEVTKDRETLEFGHSESSEEQVTPPENVPNIVVIMGDDWSWPHASILGDKTVRTPNFDRIAKEGVLFENAFVSAPSCTPSRFAVASGQYHWRLGEGVNLGGSLADDLPVYPDLLAEKGIFTGFARKGAGPSRHAYRGTDPFGPRFRDFPEFFDSRETGRPFAFWYGAGEPHRAYDWQASLESDLDVDGIQVPPWLPENKTVRTDLGDYYLRIEKLDQFAGQILAKLEEAGELENTIVVMTGDNGMPFPRSKATLFDSGTRVPLAIRWGREVPGGRVVSDFVNLTDLAPTFLEACGLKVPEEMTGRSLLTVLQSEESGVVEADRDHVLLGMERHVYPNPSRAIRTEKFLYVRNFAPESWPTGVPKGEPLVFDFKKTPWPTVSGAFSYNVDPSPTKQWMRLNESPYNAQAFGRKPAEELYDLCTDPDQLTNLLAVKEVPGWAEEARKKLAQRLASGLRESGDPRFEEPGHATFSILGWTIHLSDQLVSGEPVATARMLELMHVQLQRVIDVVPRPGLTHLQQVPIWINPSYEGIRGTAEYHPDAGWLKNNGRNPAMGRAIEITNVKDFPFENRRMPYVMLHELAHGYHDRVIQDGYGNAEIRKAYERARDSGSYEEVARFNGNRTVKDKAYGMSNPMEYFAESTEAYFGKNDFFPFNREELKKHDPEMHKLVQKMWNIPHPHDWSIDSSMEWKESQEGGEGWEIKNGLASAAGRESFFRSKLHVVPETRKADSLVFTPSPHWNNWTSIPSVGPKEASNAPVFLPISDKDYWFFGAKKGAGRGYHAWRSSDLKTWKHMGPAGWSNWATTAEYADGKIFLYYDEPNDQDPHLLIGENLNGELKWTDHGKVLSDPSHGSDAGVIRTQDGVFHLIYEDWRPLNARQHSWDSPLAGHSDSRDGKVGFRPHEFPFPIDLRTKPTGEFGEYEHSSRSYALKYEIHEGEQDAYGDYTAIQVGDRFYLFCDYDPHGEPMRVGCFYGDSIYEPFSWSGDIGMGFHPDPTIGFANGQFYLIVQRAKEDFVSPGPWNGRVTARAGVDVDGDAKVDQWTEWQEVSESYRRKKGFARVIETDPAQLDLSVLQAGKGFQFEFKTTQEEGKPSASLDSVTLHFD